MQKTDFRSISFADSKGAPYDRPDISIAERDYFKSAMAGIPYISSPLISKKDNSIVLYVSAKVNNGGYYDGIVFGELSTDIIQSDSSGCRYRRKRLRFYHWTRKAQ
jgi:hypothetical protein